MVRAHPRRSERGDVHVHVALRGAFDAERDVGWCGGRAMMRITGMLGKMVWGGMHLVRVHSDLVGLWQLRWGGIGEGGIVILQYHG